jgi:hypothetical protein
LDFKTREELQQMPQTEEEHLENQYLDYEDKEKSITDAEVKSPQNSLPLQFPNRKNSLKENVTIYHKIHSYFFVCLLPSPFSEHSSKALI